MCNMTAILKTLVLTAIVIAWPSNWQTLLAEPIAAGTSSFAFESPNGDKMTVWAYCPERHNQDTPVLFVLHGTKRNADQYRDAWIEHAKRIGALLLVPEFTKADFPAGEGYQQLNVVTAEGKPLPREKWACQRIEQLFDFVIQENHLSAKDYYLYGHSAGGQFVHRMMLLMPEARVALAIPANSGWYTLPKLDLAYPEGLDATPADEESLKQVLSKNVVVLLGDADNDPNHKYLPRGRAAMKQGPHRFARGQHFVDTLQKEAARLGIKPQWKVEVVPGVGHSDPKMSPVAAKLIAEHVESRQR